MKRKWIIILGVLSVVVTAIFVSRPASRSRGLVSVSLLSTTTNQAGARLGLFSLTNGTDYLFVRGRSEIEVRMGSTNQSTVVQITTVDYLEAGQLKVFSVASPGVARPWRVRFTYINQFKRLESFEYEIGWYLYRHGIPIPLKKLPEHDVREVTTEWITE